MAADLKDYAAVGSKLFKLTAAVFKAKAFLK